ncbi:MAG: hypothetical protein U0002_04330 [Thermoanaerobaculia bacterium]
MQKLALVALLGLVLSLPALAADPVIFKGIDVFTTTADGSTHYDFKTSPIPAGFFCPGSAPFTGQVAFRGLPLVTGVPGQLGGADTIVERLDDAVFDAQGRAVTRVQLRALSLVSLAPISTSCGRFNVYASLAGTQRITTMNIFRLHEKSGVFSAPLAVDARLSFVPVLGKASRPLELQGSFNLSGGEPIPWAKPGNASSAPTGAVLVDTNGDGKVETRLAGTSNFVAGARSASDDGVQLPPRALLECACGCWYTSCHTDPATGKDHCVQRCGYEP